MIPKLNDQPKTVSASLHLAQRWIARFEIVISGEFWCGRCRSIVNGLMNFEICSGNWWSIRNQKRLDKTIRAQPRRSLAIPAGIGDEDVRQAHSAKKNPFSSLDWLLFRVGTLIIKV